MPYELLYNRLPKIAERETRNIIITEDSGLEGLRRGLRRGGFAGSDLVIMLFARCHEWFRGKERLHIRFEKV